MHNLIGSIGYICTQTYERTTGLNLKSNDHVVWHSCQLRRFLLVGHSKKNLKREASRRHSGQMPNHNCHLSRVFDFVPKDSKIIG